MLVTEEDLKRFAKYCNKGSRHFDSTREYYIFESWKDAFIGENKYHMIQYGISGLYDYEKEESNPFDCFKVDDNSGREYFVAFHQWNAYKAWLSLFLGKEECFLQFEVCFLFV
jgi:hypothetical protein